MGGPSEFDEITVARLPMSLLGFAAIVVHSSRLTAGNDKPNGVAEAGGRGTCAHDLSARLAPWWNVVGCCSSWCPPLTARSSTRSPSTASRTAPGQGRSPSARIVTSCETRGTMSGCRTRSWSCSSSTSTGSRIMTLISSPSCRWETLSTPPTCPSAGSRKQVSTRRPTGGRRAVSAVDRLRPVSNVCRRQVTSRRRKG